MQTDPNHKQFFQVVLMKLCLVSVVSMCSGYNAGHPQPTCSPSGRQLMVKPFTENKASLVRWNQLVMAPGRKSGKEHSCLAAWQMLWHVVTVISVKLGDVMKCIDMYIYIIWLWLWIDYVSQGSIHLRIKLQVGRLLTVCWVGEQDRSPWPGQ